MRSFFFIVIFFFTLSCFAQRKVSVPQAIATKFKVLGLNKNYSISGFLQPTTLEADFNRDGIQDFAVSIFENKSSKEGLLILHGGSTAYFVFGAGKKVGNSSGDFKWAGKWSLYKEEMAYDIHADETNDSLEVAEPIELKGPGILVETLKSEEAYSGGIIYWDGKTYLWIRQGE